MMKKIIVVGCGRWGSNHIRTLINLQSLGGVVESDEITQNRLKHEFPGIIIFKSLKDSFNYKSDGYIVSTPPSTHFEVGEEIIRNKKPLLIEKPLTLDYKTSKKLVDLARKNNVNLMVGHVLLFHPAIRKIKALIDEGFLGNLKYLYSNRLNLGIIRASEDVFWSLASHDLSVFKYLINLDPIEYNSSSQSFLNKGINDITIANFKYINNVKGHIFASWVNPFKEHKLVVIGSKGMLVFEDSSDKKDIIFYKDYYKVSIDGTIEAINQKGEIIIYDKESKPLTNELNYFIENLDKQIEISSGDIGLEVVRLLEEI